MNDLREKVIDNKYRLVRLIGEGGMGAVYEADHVRLKRKFAVKVMHPKGDSPNSSVERFHREALAASSIGHPNIVEVFDVGLEEDGTAYMVMELLKGVSLASMLRIDGKLAAGRTISITLQILSALTAAHRKGIIHRDLKPDNVFISVDSLMREVIKILDFGVAKVQGEKIKEKSLTDSGVVFGSPYYLSPEQARGRKDIDGRIDIYAVGVIMYCVLTGKRPFEGAGYNEIVAQILTAVPAPVNVLVPGTPPELVSIVKRAMARDRDDRFGSAIEMIDALLPLHDPFEEEMNTGVFEAIRERPSAPPPLLDDRFSVEIPDEPPPSASKKSDPLAHTLPTGPSAVGGSGDRSLKRTALLAGGIALAACLLIGGLLLFVANQNATGKPPTAPGQPDPPLEPSPEPDPLPGPGDTVTEQADAGPAAGVLPVAELPARVTITLEGVPKKARVSIDNKKVKHPIALTGSGQAVLLKVLARGYKPFVQALIPDRDQTIVLDLVEKPVAAERPTVPKKKKKKQKNGASWADNPFN